MFKNTKCPLSAFPTFLLQLIKMVITRRYSVIMFRYSVITCLSLVAGEDVLFHGEKSDFYACFFLVKIFETDNPCGSNQGGGGSTIPGEGN